eukprot:3050094-Amphidinium_carterae.1
MGECSTPHQSLGPKASNWGHGRGNSFPTTAISHFSILLETKPSLTNAEHVASNLKLCNTSRSQA